MKKDYCSNCHHPIEEMDQYCRNCGQKNVVGRIRFVDLVSEFFSNIFNWDSKLLITPLMLCRPGFLTKEFFDGKRKRYTHPVRLLFIILFAFFTTLFFVIGDDFGSSDLSEGEFLEMSYVYRFVEKNKLEIDSFLDERYDNSLQDGVLDTLELFLKEKYTPDSSFMTYNNKKIATKDMVILSSAEIAEKYELDDDFLLKMIQNLTASSHNPEKYLQTLSKWGSWAVIFTIPILSMFLYLFYKRRGRYFVEHLVFVLHITSFLFLMWILILLIDYYLWLDEIYFLLPFIISILYSFPAMKVFYKQNYPKTVLKYIILTILILLFAFIYVITFIILSLSLF